jgi:hypothetical protein
VFNDWNKTSGKVCKFSLKHHFHIESGNHTTFCPTTALGKNAEFEAAGFSNLALSWKLTEILRSLPLRIEYLFFCPSSNMAATKTTQIF